MLTFVSLRYGASQKRTSLDSRLLVGAIGYHPGNVDRIFDELSVLKLVTRRLEEAEIPYMLTGSLAASHYAQPRKTRDIDLVVELEPSDTPRLTAMFGEDFDVNEPSVQDAIRRRGMST